MIRCAHLFTITLPFLFLVACSSGGLPVSAVNPDQNNESEAAELMPQTDGECADPADHQSNTVDGAGRELTKWVLQHGGTIAAYVGEQQMTWERRAELPSGKIEPYRVKLERAKISDDDMKRFAGHPRLRDLYLNGSTVTDKGLAQLKNLPALETLQLGGTQITDKGAAHFKQVKSVQQLYLNSTGIGDAGVQHISRLPSVTVLWLADTKVTDAGLVDIGKIKTLFRLNLQMTRVTDSGLKHLSGLRSLNSCDVRHTDVTKSGAETLDEQLPNGTVVFE